MMMFNMFICDVEVNIKSVLIGFGMTRISGRWERWQGELWGADDALHKGS